MREFHITFSYLFIVYLIFQKYCFQPVYISAVYISIYQSRGPDLLVVQIEYGFVYK